MRRRLSNIWDNVEPAIMPSQCRAARATLRIGLRDLAVLAGISAMTISRFENGHSSVTPQAVGAIRTALEREGAEIGPSHRIAETDA